MNTKIVLMDRLAADPNVWNTQDGKLVSSFPIPVEPTSADDGEAEPDVYVCVAFGQLAEKTRSLLRKGVVVIAEGTLASHLINHAQGARRCVSEVLLERLSVVETGTNQIKADTPIFNRTA